MQLVGIAQTCCLGHLLKGEAETCWQPRGKEELLGEHPAGVGVAQEVTWHIQSQTQTVGRRQTFRHWSCSERSVVSRGETVLQRKAQKEDFLSNRWCEVNHLCVSTKCVTPDTFPLLQISSTAGTFSQSCSSGLSHSLYPKSPSPCPRQLLDRNKTQELQAELQQQHCQGSL